MEQDLVLTINKEQIKKKYFDLIEQKCSEAIPLLIVIVGSQAYGTNLPTLDFDMSGIFIQSKEDIYGFNYIEKMKKKKKKEISKRKIKMTLFFMRLKGFCN